MSHHQLLIDSPLWWSFNYPWPTIKHQHSKPVVSHEEPSWTNHGPTMSQSVLTNYLPSIKHQLNTNNPWLLVLNHFSIIFNHKPTSQSPSVNHPIASLPTHQPTHQPTHEPSINQPMNQPWATLSVPWRRCCVRSSRAFASCGASCPLAWSRNSRSRWCTLSRRLAWRGMMVSHHGTT